MTVLGEPFLYRETRDVPDVIESGLSVLHRVASEARSALIVSVVLAAALGITVVIGVYLLPHTGAAL